MQFYSKHQRKRLHAARLAVDPATATIVYATWENPFAKGGGIFAVASNYGAELVRQGRDLVLLSPYHTFLSSSPRPGVDVQEVARGRVEYDGANVEFGVHEHLDRNGCRWLLVKAPPFFEDGADQTDPYQPYEGLLRQALFFSKVAPFALAAAGLTKNLILHLQDWQAAGIALTAKEAVFAGVIESCASVLTMHNPYDRSMETRNLRLLSDKAPSTVYEWMIPLLDGPLSTVSDAFAAELTSDPLQTGCFATHLQHLLGSLGVTGVNNGLFGKPAEAYSEAARAAAKAGSPGPILDEKLAKRRGMLEILAGLNDSRTIGSLDFDHLLTRDDIPVFMMFGRLDPGQKGFDVLAQSIETLCERRVDARFILAPSVLDQNSPFAGSEDTRRQMAAVAQLGLLAHRLPGRVVIYPFRMEAGYMEAMGGSTFAVMPSLYEPFGGATEPFLVGTPVIARKTGGLQQQVVDGKTGFLFRETPEGDQQLLEAEWRHLQSAGVTDRMKIGLYREIVAALTSAIEAACEFHRSNPTAYAAMLPNLAAKAREFSWSKTAAEYQRIYEKATA